MARLFYNLGRYFRCKVTKGVMLGKKEFREKGNQFAKANFAYVECVGKVYGLLQDMKSRPNPSCFF
jgi:hypothetical protein